ncbi:MAG: dehydrogenase E1 component subunit alpha/beta [Verrucomicrobiota bacterium]|jgi:2-oxoisovalerate dehydrogenase E1 component|nr:dehydrogenase E1 component subunit alpha/beta [Verrucomicrobiota bacterium]
MPTNNYLSTLKPAFKPATYSLGKIPAYQYKGALKDELAAGTLTAAQATDLLEDMLTIREFEEMIVKLRTGAYESCKGYDYRGPTHVSIGQEATAVGCCAALAYDDQITSTHRGHGDSLAKGCAAIRGMSVDELKARVPESAAAKKKELVEAALEKHVYRAIAELFGKEDGYCKGRGGGMHIADFKAGHLGANAIVGGGVPIATGSALSSRTLKDGKVTCCFAGDGAYANGVVLEALNFAAMGQFTGKDYTDAPFGLPVVYAVINNHYGFTGRIDGEVAGVSTVARRAAGFADNNMHAEVVNGMDILACIDAMRRAASLCRQGQGPVLVEFDTYRNYGHSLGDPRNEYRTKDEEAEWKALDPVAALERQLLDTKSITPKKLDELKAKVADRNARMAAKAAWAKDPDPADVIKYMYTDTRADTVPAPFAGVKPPAEPPAIKRTDDGQLTYKDAIKEAMIEEMLRDSRVVQWGEDIAEYGGAFKVTKGLTEAFGRARVFNAPISEACICGTAVGAAMTGLRPVVELMYMDFGLMASDQISNQAAKWHYMSGASIEVPLVYRASVGGGKGYGGQHSQTLESMFAHIPGLYVVYPATPYDAKGMLKSAIRDNNPILFVESQIMYNYKGVVPREEYLIPLGKADVKRAGDTVTVVTWGPMLYEAIKAADQLAAEGVSVEIIDIRSLVPLDMETILASVRKTGRCVVASHCVGIGSFTGEIASRIMAEAFDSLDAPVLRVGAKDGIAPQAYSLEDAFLPHDRDIIAAVRQIL